MHCWLWAVCSKHFRRVPSFLLVCFGKQATWLRNFILLLIKVGTCSCILFPNIFFSDYLLKWISSVNDFGNAPFGNIINHVSLLFASSLLVVLITFVTLSILLRFIIHTVGCQIMQTSASNIAKSPASCFWIMMCTNRLELWKELQKAYNEIEFTAKCLCPSLSNPLSSYV